MLAGAASAQTISAVTDGASFGPRVVPGELATIFGASLASSTAQPSSLPLPTSLNGTTVLVNSIAAPLVYISATQINFQVPSSLTASPVTVQVKAPSGATATVSVPLVLAGPAIFQYPTNRAVAQNADGTLNSSKNPAATNSVITVYLTGQGAVNHPVTDGAATPSSPLATATGTSTATVGIQNATVQFLGLAPGFVGLAQANILLPSLPTGDYPLVITVGNMMSTSAVVSLKNSNGTTYTSPLTFVGQASFANSAASNVALLGTTAYVCGANEITIVDVTTPSAPVNLGSFGSAQLNGLGTTCAVNIAGINTAGSIPFLVDVVGLTNSYTTQTPVNSSFAVYNVATPTSPVLLTLAPTSYPYITSFSFLGTFGLVTTSYFTFNSNLDITGQNGNYFAFDFTASSTGATSAPDVIGSLQNLPNLTPYSAVLNSAFAYIAGSTGTGANVNGTGVLDVVAFGGGSAAAPAILGSVTASPAAILLSFDIANNILVAAGNTTENRDPGNPNFAFTGHLTLTTFSIINQENPAVQASFDTGMPVDGTPTTRAFSNAVFAVISNSAAADVTGPSSLSILDARTPASPLLYPFLTEFGLSGALATNGGYLLVPTVHGLSIYSLNLQ
ncbi:MAG TPA: hypothetical protein VKG25_00985 [Bryobacteraceae bacterium]|nr:hypothetical protein [Bryobacteraceae bacterium]